MAKRKTILRFLEYFEFQKHPDINHRISDLAGFADNLEILNKKIVDSSLISRKEPPHHEQPTNYPCEIDVKILSGKYHLRHWLIILLDKENAPPQPK
jgi:hypothetical protein